MPKQKRKQSISIKKKTKSGRIIVFSKPGSGNGGQKPPKPDKLPKKGS